MDYIGTKKEIFAIGQVKQNVKLRNVSKLVSCFLVSSPAAHDALFSSNACTNTIISASTPQTPTSTSKPQTTQEWQTQKTTYRTTRKPTTTTTTTTTETSLQEKCQTGQYYPHEQCNKFYVCVNGVLITQSCAPGLSWNTDKLMCDWDHRIRCLGRIKYNNPFAQALTLGKKVVISFH